LFISALLTKQFFSEDLYGTDGDVSRYNFGSTGDALITIFIILTGENWNQIMVEVIDKKKDFTVSVFFICLMMIGNFMLLNLFLAILLKSISEIGTKEKEDGDAGKEEKEEEMSNKDDQDANEKDQLNSSNSNIEEEFDQIKK
jgi:voltage-dependent calcium channel L type alpha-1D